MAGNTDGRDATGQQSGADSTNDTGWDAERRWWREQFRTRPYVADDRPFTTYEAAYRFGFVAARRNGSRPWREAVPGLRDEWAASDTPLDWAAVSGAVQDAFTRTARRRREAERRRAIVHGDAMLLV